MFVHTVHRAAVSKFFLGVLIASLPYTLADEFTTPSNSEADLAVHYTLGETVIITWETSLSILSLYVSHWGGNVVGSLLTDATNPGLFVWTIGESDNINAQLLSGSSNYVLIIRDPSGQTGTGNGFVNGELQSRGFVIDAADSSSSSSSSSSAASSSTSSSSSPSSSSSSTSSSSSAASTSSTPPTSVSTSTTAASTPSSSATSAASAVGLSTGVKAGIGVGAAIGGLALIALGAIATVLLSRRRRQKREAEQQQQQHAAVPSEDKYPYYPPSDHLYSNAANEHLAQPSYQQTVPVNELSDTSIQPYTRHELGNSR